MTPLGTAPGGTGMVRPAAVVSSIPPDESNVLVRTAFWKSTLGNAAAEKD